MGGRCSADRETKLPVRSSEHLHRSRHHRRHHHHHHHHHHHRRRVCNSCPQHLVDTLSCSESAVEEREDLLLQSSCAVTPMDSSMSMKVGQVRVPEDVPLRSLWKEAQAAQSSRRAKSELPAAATAPAATGTSKRLDFNDDSPRRALAEEIAQTVKGRIEALCRDVPKLVGEAKVTKRANAKSDLVRPQPPQPQQQPQPQQPQASCMRQLEEQQGRLDSLLEDIQSQSLFEPRVLRTPPSKQPDRVQKQEGQSSPAEAGGGRRGMDNIGCIMLPGQEAREPSMRDWMLSGARHSELLAEAEPASHTMQWIKDEP